MISHSSSSPFFLGTHAPLSHCLCWSVEVEWDPHLGALLFTNLGGRTLLLLAAALCLGGSFSPCCSLSRPANISLVSFVHPLNERPRITPALCSDLERQGRADVLVGTAARLTTSELLLCQPEQGAVAALALFSFPLVCFLEI